MEASIQKIKNKVFWRRLGIVTLWLSSFYLTWLSMVSRESIAILGVYIGESIVFGAWAVKETILEIVRSRKRESYISPIAMLK